LWRRALPPGELLQVDIDCQIEPAFVDGTLTRASGRAAEDLVTANFTP
jgi:hypothetical protein